MGLALEKATDTTLVTGPMQLLWNDLQAEYKALWSVDQMGFAWHESGFVVTARDLLRIGELMLNEGRVGDRQVVLIDWLAQSLAQDETGSATRFGSLEVSYNNGWRTADRVAGPNDIFSIGRHGQVMLISPINNIAIVRLGRNGNRESNIALTSRLRRVADRLSRIENR